jgi:hypothetical protein
MLAAQLFCKSFEAIGSTCRYNDVRTCSGEDASETLPQPGGSTRDYCNPSI